jgi:hypothetical protein
VIVQLATDHLCVCVSCSELSVRSTGALTI